MICLHCPPSFAELYSGADEARLGRGLLLEQVSEWGALSPNAGWLCSTLHLHHITMEWSWLHSRAQRRRDRAKPSFLSDKTQSKQTEPPPTPAAALDGMQLIKTPVLYNGIMKPMARQVLINTAEKNGVQWRNAVSEWEDSKGEVDAEFARLTDPSITYPVRTVRRPSARVPRHLLPLSHHHHRPFLPQDYYLMPFHAYDEGNLNWLAAFEAESATYAMALRVWPQEVKAGTLDSLEAQRRLRTGYTDALAAYVKQHGLPEPKEILDIGCSVRVAGGGAARAVRRLVSAAIPRSSTASSERTPGRPQIGISTRALSSAFPEARLTGLDLSVYMLAVASLMDRKGKARKRRTAPLLLDAPCTHIPFHARGPACRATPLSVTRALAGAVL